jgi:hypothetical protein
MPPSISLVRAAFQSKHALLGLLGFPPALAARLFPFALFGLLLGSGSATRFHPTRSSILLHVSYYIVYVLLDYLNIPTQITHVIWASAYSDHQ